MIRRFVMDGLLSIGIAVFAVTALALDISEDAQLGQKAAEGMTSIVTGRLKVVDYSPHEHHPLKVFMAVPMPMCGPDTLDWAYANRYHTFFMNILLTAKAAGFSVAVTSALDDEGFCEIQAIRVE